MSDTACLICFVVFWTPNAYGIVAIRWFFFNSILDHAMITWKIMFDASFVKYERVYAYSSAKRSKPFYNCIYQMLLSCVMQIHCKNSESYKLVSVDHMSNNRKRRYGTLCWIEKLSVLWVQLLWNKHLSCFTYFLCVSGGLSQGYALSPLFFKL